MMRQEGKYGRFSKEADVPMTQEVTEKKSPDELIKQINSLMNKDTNIVEVAKLLKHLITYGKV